MATPDEDEEVYLNLRHVTPWFKKKAKSKLTVTQEGGEIQSQHNQAYQGFSDRENNSSQDSERAKSVHENTSVKDLVKNAEIQSKPGADISGTPSVTYERFSDILTDGIAHTKDCNKPELKTVKPTSNYTFRNFLLISIIVLIVSAIVSIIVGLVVESIISKKLVDDKTEERSRQERLKTNAEWSIWTDWGHCSVSCDLGLRSRDRKCLVQNTTFTEDYCIGLSHQEIICRGRSCADGGWGNWNPWSPCSVTCGVGTRLRSRQCDNPTPSVLGADCRGLPVEIDVCLSQSCTDGVWSPWSSWGTCSATCNGGLRSRTRQCTDPAPSVLGRQCLGNNEDTTMCNTNKCKDPLVYFNAYIPNLVDGKVTFHTSVGSSSFNKSSGYFTCPVPGLYYFTVNFMVKSSSYPYCYIRCKINGTPYYRDYTKTGGSSSYYWSASGGAYCQLNIGDQAYLSCYSMSNIHSHSYIAFFTGALITPS